MTRSIRIAISGIGIVGPGGVGADAFREALRNGTSRAVTVERFPTAAMKSHTAALVTEFKAKDFIPAMKLRRMNNLSRMSLAAAKLAVEQSGLAAAGLARHDVGVAMGTAFGPVQTSVDYMLEYLAKGAALAPPQLFAESVANAPGSHIAIEHGFEGFNVTFTQRESSALAALMFASHQLAKGSARAALSGGVDETNELLYGVLDRIGALASAKKALDEAPRPFDKRRNGFMIGEGAAAFILEMPSAVRGEPWGYVSGFGIAKDPTATISDWGSDPDAVVRAMSDAIADAELAPAEISAVFASANGSVRGDRIEALALRALFGDAVPPVVATKGIFGEYSAAGGLQLASALMALRDQELHASAGFSLSSEDMKLPVSTSRRAATLHHVIVNSISAGGGVVSAVLSRSARD